MVSKPVMYGIIAVLLAGTLVASSIAALYYSQYQNQVSENQRRIGELKSELAKYDSLASSYNMSLHDYNASIALLADAVAHLNTSTPSYINGSRALASLWSSYRSLASVSGRTVTGYTVEVLVDFGNGTRNWHNGTDVQPGWNGYLATVVALGGQVGAAWYPQYNEHFVSSLDGVSGSQSTSWFVWSRASGGWQISETGADAVPVYNGTMLAWTLCGYDASFNPTCKP